MLICLILTDQYVRRSLASRWKMPVELALDLVALALYDIVIYADDSTSMKYAENGSRIDDMKVVLERVTEVATLFDSDGMKHFLHQLVVACTPPCFIFTPPSASTMQSVQSSSSQVERLLQVCSVPFGQVPCSCRI